MSARSDPHDEFVGRNCLYVSKDIEEVASNFEMDSEEMQSLLATCREKIYRQRQKRPKPHLDNKVLPALFYATV